MRPLLIDHLHDHAHGLRDDQNVGEDNGRIEKTFVTLDGLQGQSGGDLGVSTTLEKVAAALGLMIFRKIAASWCGISACTESMPPQCDA